MLKQITRQRAALIVFAVAIATIGGAWLFEYWGYAPCPLCLKQRWSYYAAMPLALAAAALAQGNAAVSKTLLYILALIFAASAVFGVYHSGVEWKWWPGPDTCGGDFGGGLPDLSKPAIRCDEAAIRIFGLSLAGWNAVISLVLAAIAGAGARHQGSSSVSQ